MIWLPGIPGNYAHVHRQSVPGQVFCMPEYEASRVSSSGCQAANQIGSENTACEVGFS